MSKFISILILFVLLSLGCFTNDDNVVTKSIANYKNSAPLNPDFNFHIRPILSDKCFKCHGPDKNKIEAGLSFASEGEALASLESDRSKFAIVKGYPEKSVLIDRIYSDDPSLIMPPPESHLTLNSYEKEVLKNWIKNGAHWQKHWAFLPIEYGNIPNSLKERHEHIDYLIRTKLNEKGLSPSEKADKNRIIRRVTFDLTGLPPTIDEIEEFINDVSEDAYEKVVDRLLATEAYAENMASYWMDLARYADTHGYQDDLERVMWPWRDWVIHAFNKNMPYNDFVTWQLAGDLLPNATKEQIIATAFNRNHKITQEGGVIPEEYRVEYVADRTLTFGKAFLGLTMECARCHDHKYDPISQKDYFSLFAFFNNVPEEGLIKNYGDIPKPYITLTSNEIQSQLSFINNLDTIDNIHLMVMEEKKEKRKTYILERGEYDKPKDEVQADTPEALIPIGARSGTRLELAKWLFDKDNPLTSRVFVNRLWQICFEKGIVKTSDDFGAQGALPSHPKLLDYLSKMFIDDGWDIKKMLKYLVMTETYRQSSKVNEKHLEVDPENIYLSRAPRMRLTAEKIVDHMLFTSGMMVREIGGPSVKPYQPEGLWKETTGGGGGSTAEYKRDTNERQYRRSLYTFWKRTVPPPSMMTFDAVTRDFCMVQRESTSTPLQALVMMNDPRVIEASRNLVYNYFDQSNIEQSIADMFYAVTSRKASKEELELLISFYTDEKNKFEKNGEDAMAFLKIGDSPHVELASHDIMAAMTYVANTIYNLDESISRS